MAAMLTASMVCAPVARVAAAKAQAAPAAARPALKAQSFSARLGVSNATEKKTNAFMVWKSQGNKCVPARERRRARARSGTAAASQP